MIQRKCRSVNRRKLRYKSKREAIMAWIRTIEPEGATGKLKKEYDRAAKRAGKVFNILKIQSLNPETLSASMGLYVATMHAPSKLSRAERELLAVVVSWANNCFY
jgi:alkylhydroperoxidase family enzyme